MTAQNIKLCAIVAMAENRVIGKDNSLIWHLPEDLKHFKRTTMGKPMIMGRKSFESLPGLLPGRPHIIISRSDTTFEGAHHVSSIEEGIALGRKIAEEAGQDEIFITGGGEIYKQTLPDIERLYLTIVHDEFEGDTYFPAINWDEWDITEDIEHEADEEKSRPAFTIFTLDRK